MSMSFRGVTRGVRVDPVKHPDTGEVLSSMTKQSFKKECDINVLMARYAKNGSIDHFAKYGPRYGDFTHVDFQEAMNVLRKSEEMFEDLPSEIRKRFGNSPAEFLKFIHNKDNQAEALKLGLAEKAKPLPARLEDVVAAIAAGRAGGPGGAAPPAAGPPTQSAT